MAEDEGPAPHNGRRAVNSLIMLLVPGAGHAHRVEEHISVKLNLGETFSWQVDTIRHLLAHPRHVEKETGQAVQVDRSLVSRSLLQPLEHPLSLQAVLGENVDRGQVLTRAATSEAVDDPFKNGRIVLVGSRHVKFYFVSLAGVVDAVRSISKWKRSRMN